MSYANLLIEDKDAVRTISVNRPDKLNALNQATIGELQDAFDAARSDPGVRVVVLTGSGAKVSRQAATGAGVGFSAFGSGALRLASR